MASGQNKLPNNIDTKLFVVNNIKYRKVFMIDGTSDKIFGIGLSKTGTTNLSEALRILGYKTLHYNNIILRYTAGTLKLDLNIINSNDAFTDIGIVKFYKQLDINYPNSKFILTVREIDSWLKSCQAHWCKKSLKEKII